MEVTQLLQKWRQGDEGALAELMPVVYDELRRLAGGYLSRERPDHTLQPTALINEAWIRLARNESLPDWKDRSHFIAIAANIMRRVLIDHARGHKALKRHGSGVTVCLEDASEEQLQNDVVDVLALDEALEKLEKLDSRQSRVIELRFFGGLSLEETAEVLGVSVSVVSRETRAARAWLYTQLASNRS